MSERPSWMIVGLGNPGRQYARTRHNVGFMVLDLLRRELPPGTERKRFDAQIIETSDALGRVILIEPQTFMNRSGLAVAPAARWYKVRPERILVIHDELDLPFGQLRLRPGGSSAGHNGITSIIQQLGTEGFPRLRIGVGRPEHGATIGYVLSRFQPEEERLLPDLLARAADAARAWRREGIDVAMNQFNRRGAIDVRDEPADKRT
ncbi:MAG TPA: aminoacyl-tRNA hydrolase [Thermomicrobiaceae bacterium]|nr:aminoacyl-tRNA hydrolase [Thermomicrobiaceae bacterium]